MLGKVMTFARFFTPRLPFEPNKAQELIGCSSDEHLEQRLIECFLARTVLAFPSNPLLLQNLLRLTFLKLYGDRKPSGIAQHRICCNKKSHFRIYADEQGHIEAERILPNFVKTT